MCFACHLYFRWCFFRVCVIVESLEHRFLNTVSSVVPWLAPAPTAWIAFVHLSAELALPLPIAAAGALVVEGLGLSTVHTALSFWKDDGLRSARLWLAIGAGGFYLAVVIVVNIILDTGPWATVTAKSLLSLTSIPAALIVALRAQDARRRAAVLEATAHAEREQATARESERLAREEAAAERKHARELRHTEKLAEIQARSTERLPERSVESSGTFPKDWRKLSSEQRRQIAELSVPQIIELTGLTHKAASNWLRRSSANGHIQEN